MEQLQVGPDKSRDSIALFPGLGAASANDGGCAHYREFAPMSMSATVEC